ncbi:hypothetical protein [Streptomyces sp. TRM64462]|uniref:hypothetical protein n=1 Tax=Streptomyces sp. TRM64462 TaxID=2741726 RepID=UPI002814CCBE|nr:hypothetical protein [Streptomyces sp. TRM64462]
MNQQPPPGHQPYPPQSPHPCQPYVPPQPPKKGMSTGAIVAITLGSVFVALILLGALVGGSSDTASRPKAPAASTAQGQDAKPAEKPAEPATPVKEQSQADQFKEFVAKNGTPQEKTAAEHVTRIQGADEQNDLLDTAEIHTDYAGGLLGPNAGKGKLLASVFAEWRQSKNGLVTVYDKDGEILANGNY